MGDPNTPVLHHVEICVGDESSILATLTKGLGFKISYYRSTKKGLQWVLSSGKSIFFVTRKQKPPQEPFISDSNAYQNTKDSCNTIQRGCELSSGSSVEEDSQYLKNTYPLLFCGCRDDSHSIDSVFNAAFEVKNVDDITNRIKSKGETDVICEPYTITDDYGTLRLAIVASKCENIIHTLLDRSNYRGRFLPGFVSATECLLPNSISHGLTKDIIVEDLTRYIDHLTFVCRPDESSEIIKWYEECFHMKRFFSNSEDSVEDGFVLGEGIGLRLKALQYWRCAETGVRSPVDLNHPDVLRIVIAEPLPDIKDSHVDKFLNEHSGPGMQHIGLYSDNIVQDVAFMKDRGVRFRMPPPTYYEECGKLSEIVEAGLISNLDGLRTSGILLDTEEDCIDGNSKGYLMQIFTHPVFTKDTFFFEVIQRRGAIGFGAGNITALARSIVVYQEQLQRKKLEDGTL